MKNYYMISLKIEKYEWSFKGQPTFLEFKNINCDEEITKALINIIRKILPEINGLLQQKPEG